MFLSLDRTLQTETANQHCSVVCFSLIICLNIMLDSIKLKCILIRLDVVHTYSDILARLVVHNLHEDTHKDTLR